MFNNKKTTFLFCCLVCLSLVVWLTGCSDSGNEKAGASDPADFYNAVQLGQTKTEVEKELDVKPVEKDESYIYMDADTDFGVQVSYDAADLVSMKILYNEDDSQVMALSEASVSENQLESIKEGMTYEEVTSILGSEGMEIIRVANLVDPNTPTIMMIWFNDDQTGFYIPFFGEKGTVQSVKYWK